MTILPLGKTRPWQFPVIMAAVVMLLANSAVRVPAADVITPKQQADYIYQETGVQGGVVVHVGCGDGELTAALHAGDQYLVQGLTSDRDALSRARSTIRKQGLYGEVTARHWESGRLPYIDNLVNLLVVEEIATVSQSEILRVLVPNGVAYVNREGRWQKQVKPRPENIDEWTHYLHDSSNNAVAQDSVVGPPRRLQWDDGPLYSRHHDRMSSVSAVVSAGGRVFSIEDEQSAISILLPSRWVLTARDAFNGTVLWQRPIKKWFTQFWPLKSGPAQLPRRLIAEGDRVYVTLGFDGPFAALDAATGEQVQTYSGTAGTEEAILSNGTLYLLVNPQLEAEEFEQPERFRKAYNAPFWDGKPRTLMAFDAASGEQLWREESVVLPGTVAANANGVVFHDGESIVSLRRGDGQQLWRSEPIDRTEEIKAFYSPTLVLYQDVVLFSGGETAGKQTGSWYEKGKDSMFALALEDGRLLWTAPHPPSGYRSAEDLLVVDGLVWTGETTSGRAAGLFTGRDPRTGEVVKQFAPEVDTYWFHHRCYRGKATEDYLLMSRTGTEFIDINAQQWDINHWVRGACLYGVMPANGLLYTPRHPCACYLEAKLAGFNALAPASSQPRIPAEGRMADQERLHRGSAYDDVAIAEVEDEAAAAEWPTFRHDPQRSGHAGTRVSSEIEPAWSANFAEKLSSPVIADGRVYVAAVDTHQIHALDAATGRLMWSFQTGGRVDSPPTVYQGRVLFGSADGNVYCLRAGDGALVWQFTAAPLREQLVSFEQLESVWPVHGSLLVRDDVLYFVSGRSMFLDGGLTLWRLDPKTGQVLSKTLLDDKDSAGQSIQDYISWLNMPTALSDILSSYGDYVYMRSQPFHPSGERLPLKKMPRKGDADRGAPDPYQIAEHAHLFSPTGYLDDTWWHRTYWLYGSTYISGWSGYYLAGKVAPAGRLLVMDDERVYGFGRKPKYYRWTTPIEHQLFSAEKKLQVKLSPRRKGPEETWVAVPKSKSLNPADTAISVAAWVKANRAEGVVVARGGAAAGYALYFHQGRPTFAIRAREELSTVQSDTKAVGNWIHLVGVLHADKQMQLYVDGELVAEGKTAHLIPGDPLEPLEIGSDEGSNVGNYTGRYAFNGLVDNLRIYHRALREQEIRRAADPRGDEFASSTHLVLAYSFDEGEATDTSGQKNRGTLEGKVEIAEGRRQGKALRFLGSGTRVAGYHVVHHWTKDLPMFARAMVLSDGNLFVAGPPDVINEETTFRRISDPEIQQRLAEQLACVEGKQGGILRVVSAEDGNTLAEYQLDAPPLFDGMAAAEGRLFMITVDGKIICWK